MKREFVFVLLMIGFMLVNVSASADCPYGLVEDPYPGECGLYINEDGDNLCDHSQKVLESSEPVILERVENAAFEDGETYHLVPIFLFLIVAYFLSVWMVKSKMISLFARKKFWNMILLLSFLVSGILAILLILKINSGITFNLPFNVLFWHVDAGIVMLVLCVIHVVERWRCFL